MGRTNPARAGLTAKPAAGRGPIAEPAAGPGPKLPRGVGVKNDAPGIPPAPERPDRGERDVKLPEAKPVPGPMPLLKDERGLLTGPAMPLRIPAVPPGRTAGGMEPATAVPFTVGVPPLSVGVEPMNGTPFRDGMPEMPTP